MFRFGLVLICFFSCVDFAKADIVFTVTPLNQSVTAGQDLVFNIFVESDAGVVTIDALDLNVIAGGGDGSGGVFTAGSTFLLGSDPFDVSSTPGQAFSTNFQLGGIPINAAVLYGSLTLSTVGVAEGTYLLTMNSLAANSPSLGLINAKFEQSISYTISAVPEPSSFLFLATTAFPLAFLRSRAKRLECSARIKSSNKC